MQELQEIKYKLLEYGLPLEAYNFLLAELERRERLK